MPNRSPLESPEKIQDGDQLVRLSGQLLRLDNEKDTILNKFEIQLGRMRNIIETLSK